MTDKVINETIIQTTCRAHPPLHNFIITELSDLNVANFVVVQKKRLHKLVSREYS